MKRLSVVVSLCAALVLLGLFAAGAQASHRPNSDCSPTGDYCQFTTKNRNGVRVLQFRSFVHRGEVRVCVMAPTGTRSCATDRFRDANDDGVYVTSLRWRTHFPNEGPGAYTVVWRQDGSRIGKMMGFHRH
jgi:hypothetical protein